MAETASLQHFPLQRSYTTVEKPLPIISSLITLHLARQVFLFIYLFLMLPGRTASARGYLRFKILYWAVSNSWYAQGAKAPNGTITYIHKLVITVIMIKKFIYVSCFNHINW